jgi:N-methylhydantoinase B/oxoprolinase/acetone carboxylase alpha subunit
MAMSSAAVPQPFATMGGDTGVVGGVPGLPMTEIVLDQAQVVAAIGKIVATSVAQRVRMDVAKTGTPGGGGDEIVRRWPR